MIRCKIVSIAEGLSDVEKNDTKLHNDAELRQKALDSALHELSDTRVISVAVDRDKYTVNYTIVFEE